MKTTVHPVEFGIFNNIGELISANHLDFGLVEMDSENKRDLIIRNFNEHLPLELEFSQMANFSILPKKLSLKSGESAPFSALFRPRQIGKLEQAVNLKVRDNKSRKFRTLDGISFPVKLQGVGKGKSIDPKEKITRDEKYVRPLTGKSWKY